MNWMILFKKQLFDLEVKVPRRSLWHATHRLMVMHPHTKYHWPISKDKNVMAQTRKYYLRYNYLTLKSKVKVPWRSLRYATHHLMVMHPHTKYNWPIWKDKKLWSGQASLRKILLYSIVLVLSSLVYFGTIARDFFFYFNEIVKCFRKNSLVKAINYSIVFELTFYKSELEQTDWIHSSKRISFFYAPVLQALSMYAHLACS
jgi:hypothetical protein